MLYIYTISARALRRVPWDIILSRALFNAFHRHQVTVKTLSLSLLFAFVTQQKYFSLLPLSTLFYPVYVWVHFEYASDEGGGI